MSQVRRFREPDAVDVENAVRLNAAFYPAAASLPRRQSFPAWTGSGERFDGRPCFCRFLAPALRRPLTAKPLRPFGGNPLRAAW